VMWRQFNRCSAVLCTLAMGLCLAASPGRLEAQIIFGSAGKTQLDAFSGTFNNEVRFNNFSIVYLDEGDGILAIGPTSPFPLTVLSPRMMSSTIPAPRCFPVPMI
jgi:hypothetical protein